MRILSVQSWVAYGHVGNAAAMFPLQRLGAEVSALHTVQFSNHTGYGHWTGEVFGGDTIRSLVDGLEARGVLERTDALLSGYMGDVAIGEAILHAAARLRGARPDTLYCCDPVMGDHGRGLFVRPGIPELIERRAVPAADILTPNQFELERLTGAPCGTVAEAAAAAHRLRGRMRSDGPRLVLVTSMIGSDTPEDGLDLLLAHEDGTALLRTPRLAISPSGAGDLIAALFLFHVLRDRTASGAMTALERAAASVWNILLATEAAGERELRIVAAQEELVHPSRRFRATVLARDVVTKDAPPNGRA